MSNSRFVGDGGKIYAGGVHRKKPAYQTAKRFLVNFLHCGFRIFQQWKKSPLQKCRVCISCRAVCISCRAVCISPTRNMQNPTCSYRISFAKICMENERIIYETLIGGRCADVHWWRVRRAAKACGLPMDKNGFELLIRMRKISPKYYIHLYKIKAILDKRTADIGQGMKGREFIEYLHKGNIAPHQSTISRWFGKAGGYKASAFYNRTVLVPIMAMALIYKHQQIQGAKL